MNETAVQRQETQITSPYNASNWGNANTKKNKKIFIIIGVVSGLVVIVVIVLIVLIKKKKVKSSSLVNSRNKLLEEVFHDTIIRNKGSKKIFKKKDLKENSRILSNEVYYYNPSFEYAFKDREEAQKACESLGSVLATKEQVRKAQLSGAEWCGFGFVQSGERVYPMREHSEGCEGIEGLVQDERNSSLAGANCYGFKPAKSSNGWIAEYRPGFWSIDDY